MSQASSILLLVSLTNVLIIPLSALAQITVDGTTSTTLTTTDTGIQIDDGNQVEGNLFHSFKDFSIATGREAHFNNANDIVNIFSRVTGGNISNIDGLIRANGTANLFLINPAGIIFGENARLDVNGSFFATSADSVLFENGFEFSAVNPDAPPLLTIDIPIGLRFRDNPGDITVRGKGNGARLTDSEVIDTQEALRVDSDKTISLIGGNLLFEDATVKTAGGRIELGSVAEGEVNLVEVADGFTFDYSEIENFNDVSLSGRSVIDASGLGGGDIQVAGRNISITGVSGFTTFTLGSKPGGDINILATESLIISGVENELNFVSAIANRIFPNGTAEAGDINIETGSLRLGDRALIGTFVSGKGDAGDITIKASESISLASQGSTSAIISSVAEGAIGNGGDITINTPSLNLSNGAFLNANTSGQGNAGNITINATDTLSLDGRGTGFFTNVRTAETRGNGGNINIATSSLNIRNRASLNANSSGQGNAGNIELNSGSVTLNNGAIFSTSNFGQGNAGNVTINATESIAIDGQGNSDTDTGIFSQIGSNAVGNAGNIELNSGSLTLNNASLLLTRNLGTGKAGNVTINAQDNISFDNNSWVFVTGDEGGSININAKDLLITSGSVLFGGIPSNSGFSEAQSGDITIDLTEDLIIDGLDSEGLTLINNTSLGQGTPGNITISARNITFQNGGNLNSFVDPEQENVNIKIGDITLNATGNIIFDGIKDNRRSGILNFLRENKSGNIGEINITAQNLTLTNGAQIQSLVSGVADSGDININVANSVRIDGFGDGFTENESSVLPSEISSIIVVDGTGNAGSININTSYLSLSRNGSINAQNFGQGNGGNINIDAEQITIGKQGDTSIVPSSISTETFESGGNGGNITINTESLSIEDGGFVAANVLSGVGNGGDIKINARDIISVDGTGILFDLKQQKNIDLSSQISADVFESIGNGGDIEIDTAKLVVDNNALISADVIKSTGNSGNITISATDSVEVLGGSDIENDVFPDSTGASNNLTIETEKLTVSEGSQISASTSGDGNAGMLTIHATDSIELSGANSLGRSGLFASALEENGNSGTLEVFTQDLIIRDGATISASNFQSLGLRIPGTGEAGSLFIEAKNIILENDARITAATQAGDKGNITLKVTEDIILRDNSFISAQAFKDATGGNLDIDTRFIVAFPAQNNDIIASAAQGDGGKIDITAEGVFGIEESPLNPVTNDINASSDTGLPGEINIQQPTVDPVSGLLELTQEVVDPAKLIAQNVCTQTANSEFIDIGKGGLPPNPDDVLAEDNIEVGLVAPVTTSRQAQKTLTTRTQVKPEITRKPPAQGWIFHENGIVELVAYNPHQVGEQRIWDNYRSCQ